MIKCTHEQTYEKVRFGKVLIKCKECREILNGIFNRKNDPVYKCEYYIKHGCAHVDGFLCDMDSCNTRIK